VEERVVKLERVSPVQDYLVLLVGTSSNYILVRSPMRFARQSRVRIDHTYCESCALIESASSNRAHRPFKLQISTNEAMQSYCATSLGSSKRREKRNTDAKNHCFYFDPLHISGGGGYDSGNIAGLVVLRVLSRAHT
jgi:hypothetical protein